VGVDVARFKSEFLADYWKRHGTPLRSRVLGHVHDIARWGSRLAPLSNRVARSPAARWMNDLILGIDRRRTPPAWAARTFAEQFAPRGGRHVVEDARLDGRERVLIFNDTFTNYYNPGVGMAGVKVLAAAGLDVALAPNRCCGRPLVSQGLLEEARRLAAANAKSLRPLADQGHTIVFLEPSCLSAVRDDAPALLRGDERRQAERVAEASMLFEELLERELSQGRTPLTFGPGPSTILLHGHCHQKAMGLLAPARSLLARVPGSAVVDLDAGCCGMAGSFGYARDHFDVSRAIGERRLLPAARSLAPGSVLVASGVSCRHQVEDFTGVRALHAAELLSSLVGPPSPEPQ
jgi:Fe-S oxidoreductase